ncbi:MAG: Catabolic 3-dehydroquinase 2 [Stictis urceolatum]|nr:Catabolic 3-dehydroquinase 2 [Stictis urceolata]
MANQPADSDSTPTPPLRSILLLNGPNLNLLGTREPHLYGSTTLADLESRLAAHASYHSTILTSFQSNHEGALVDRIHAARGNIEAIVINAAAYTHTSVAIRDALLGVEIPFVEVHVTNTHRREDFRHKSFLSDRAEAVVTGMGVFGYFAAVEFVARHLKLKEREE